MRRRGSSVSIVILAFAMLIYVLIPLGKLLFELIYYHHVRERALAMTESAVYSMATQIDPFLYSESKIQLMNRNIQKYLVDDADLIKPQEVLCDLEGGILRISFAFDYPSVFTGLTKTMEVRTNYHLDMIERPVDIP